MGAKGFDYFKRASFRARGPKCGKFDCSCYTCEKVRAAGRGQKRSNTSGMDRVKAKKAIQQERNNDQ